MLKTACFLTGDNYQLVSSDTPASKKKVVALALALAVPVLIWLTNGFLHSYRVTKSSIVTAIITSLACGIIVFVIEKLIIMARGNGWLTTVRISIGILVAILGSIVLDEIVFDEDIDKQMGKLKTEAVIEAKQDAETTFRKLNDYSGLEKDINSAQNNYNSAYAEVIAEVNGKTGIKKAGVGRNTRFKDQKALERKSVLDKLIAKKNALDSEKGREVTNAGFTTDRSYNKHALLARVKALFQLVTSDTYMCIIYIVFTLLLFFFEFLVVILKSTWAKTNYERKLDMVEQIGQKRMEFLAGMNSPMVDPGNYLQQLKPARAKLLIKSSMFN